jgi:hypothetical protein
VEDVGSSEVGSSWKVSSSEKVVLVLLAVEVGGVKEGSVSSLSKRVLSRAITACAIKACTIKACAVKAGSGSCHQGGCHRGGSASWRKGGCGFLKQVKGASASLRVQILVGRAGTGARGSGSIGA